MTGKGAVLSPKALQDIQWCMKEMGEVYANYDDPAWGEEEVLRRAFELAKAIVEAMGYEVKEKTKP